MFLSSCVMHGTHDEIGLGKKTNSPPPNLAFLFDYLAYSAFSGGKCYPVVLLLIIDDLTLGLCRTY